MSFSKRLAPAIIASSFIACGPAIKPKTQEAEYLQIPQEEHLQTKYTKLARIRTILNQSIQEVHTTDRRAYWTCAEAHQECVARTSLRWAKQTNHKDQFTNCEKQLILPTHSIRNDPSDQCYFDTMESEKQYPFLIDYLTDANSCSQTVVRCLDSLSSIQQSKKIPAAIKKADLHKQPQPDLMDEEGKPERAEIQNFLGRSIGDYVKREVCEKNEDIIACKEGVSKKYAAFKEAHQEEVDTCRKTMVTTVEWEDCPDEVLKKYKADRKNIWDQQYHCRQLISVCMESALEAASQ